MGELGVGQAVGLMMLGVACIGVIAAVRVCVKNWSVTMLIIVGSVLATVWIIIGGILAGLE